MSDWKDAAVREAEVAFHEGFTNEEDFGDELEIIDIVEDITSPELAQEVKA